MSGIAHNFDDLKSRTLRGGLAKVAAQGTTLFLRIAALAVLARLLEPRDFGLIAMVVAMTGVLNIFRDFGLSTATVQSTAVTNEQLSTLFWINVLVGVALSLITAVAAPLVASFYREPDLIPITVALATAFLLNALGIQHAALLQRRMQFVTLSVFDVVSAAGSIAVGITLAALGFKYWALVCMTLTTPLLQSALAWIGAAWVPGRPNWTSGVGSMVRMGGTVTLNSLVVYVAYNAEKVLLGRVWGAAALGVYGRAYQLVNIPIEGLNSAAGQVAIAALSRVKDDANRLKRYFLRSYSLVVSVTVPCTVGTALFAADLIHVLLGPRWDDVVPVFRALTPTILVFSMINPLWWLLVPLNLVGRSLRIALVLAPIVIGSYVAGLSYGPVGVAVCYSAAMILWVVPHIAWCVHGTNISVAEILKAVAKPLLCGVISALVAWVFVQVIGQGFPVLVRLLAGLVVLFSTYAGLLMYVFRQKDLYLDTLRDLTGLARNAGAEGGRA